jgi:transcriptional regulator
MHPNLAFRTADRAKNTAFARQRAFGVLAVNAENGPLVSHVPFLLDETGKIADLHLVRSNPILSLLRSPQDAVIAVSGSDSYISPDWYEIDDQVPTWNYVAVHLRGTLEQLPQDHLEDLLKRQSAHFETQLTPKTPWTMDKMSDGVADRMMRMIVPCRMTVTSIDGTWKLNQNKPAEARLGAADQLEGAGLGQELRDLSRRMRDI